jgi:hypothetical protein
MVLTAGGPLLVLGGLPFQVQAPIAIAAWIVLCFWLILVNRRLRSSEVLAPRVARLGESLGAGSAAGILIACLGVLLPGIPWAQLVLLGLGGVFAITGMLGIPIWFVLLGRHLATLK